MIGRGGKSQSESRHVQRSAAYGGGRINVGLPLIMQLPGQLKRGTWLEVYASDAEKTNPLPIMKTMTNLWRSCGFASLATNKGTKNLKSLSDGTH
jgi:hypothetical protein